jgi:ABC-type amino acid transport system permease subunit
MWLTLRRPVVLLLITLLVAAGGAGAAAAAGQRPGAQPAVARAHTTTVVEAPARTDRSAPVTVLLVGVGAVVGVVVGLIPALVVAMLLGYLPPPRLARRRAGVLVEPPRAAPAPAATMAVAVAGPVVVAAAEDPPGGAEPPATPIAILAHARHQPLYDAAYAEQLERVETLRSAIGGRLRNRPEPPRE